MRSRSTLKRDVEALSPQIIEWRRDFHRHPEVAHQEHRTSRVLREFLEGLGFEVTTCAGTGLRAVLRGKQGGKTVALRADMDALPLKEEGRKEYISRNPGATHACAHDGHMAVLMGVAKLLNQRKRQLEGNIVFLLQPSEETMPSGARMMIEEGALKGVDAIFGLHFWQPLPTGIVGLVKGAMMAQSDEFSIKVKGSGGHGSMPHTTVDPILVASQLVVNIQSIVSRNIDPLKPAVVSFGIIRGGTVFNIIPNEVSLTGTVRTFDPSLQTLIQKRLRRIVQETCKAFGARGLLDYKVGFPPVVNNPEAADFVFKTTGRVLGRGTVRAIDPVMGGEDFAYYLQRIPGAFFFFGAGDGMSFPHHHPAFDIDERALPQATLLAANLLVEYLKGGLG